MLTILPGLTLRVSITTLPESPSSPAATQHRNESFRENIEKSYFYLHITTVEDMDMYR